MPPALPRRTARALFGALAPTSAPVEDADLVLDGPVRAALEPVLGVLHTGVRALVCGNRWYGCDGGTGRVYELNPAAPIPAAVTLLAVEGDREWDRIPAAARADHPPQFTEPAIVRCPVWRDLRTAPAGPAVLVKAHIRATVVKPTSTYPLPAAPELGERDGRPHVRVRESGKAVYDPLTRDGTKYLKPAKRWYIEFRDATGRVRRVKGYTDKKATEARAAELGRKAERVRSGYHDPTEEHVRRPLADYESHLRAKGNCERHTEQTVSKATALRSGCGFVFPPDVDAGKAAAWLNTLRRPGRLVTAPPGAETFIPADAARLLGLTPAGLWAAARRHRLAATGHGKARQIPRATVEALAGRPATGAAPATVNHYVRAVRGFFRWLVKAKRIGSNPVDMLPTLNERVDRRRSRRELTEAELRALLAATRASTRTFGGLTGADRFALYLTAAATGFRASALANLTPADFDLAADTPTVTLPARFNKSRKPKVQPIPAEAADEMRTDLAGKPATRPAWSGTWHRGRRMAEMVRRDLELVGIPYSVEGPDGPEYADFHALRHTYLTMLGRHGVDRRTAQELRRSQHPGTDRPVFPPPAIRPRRGGEETAEPDPPGPGDGGRGAAGDRDRRRAGCSDRGAGRHRAAHYGWSGATGAGRRKP